MLKRLLITILPLLPLITSAQRVELVTEFKGQQVTGISVSEQGRIFVNFPRWRETVKYSVMEVKNENLSLPYPNEAWNSWKPGSIVTDSVFVAVQSVVTKNNKLYVLDTRNPLWKGVVDKPRIFVFNLNTDKLEDTLILPEGSFKKDSYTNDLRVDDKNGFIYITDSNQPGLIVVNIKNRVSRRILDEHYSTKAETDHLTINEKKWGNKPVHSDGIAFDQKSDRLYYHSLTGYTLYSVDAKALRDGTEKQIENSVKKEAKTPAPDGMIVDEKGNLYMADLENHSIVYLNNKGQLKTLINDENLGWPDTFSIFNGYLYFTNSNIHKVRSQGENISYSVYKIKLPK